MKIIVFGVGSIGRRHIANLNKIGYTDIDIYDINNEYLDFVIHNFKINKSYNDIKEIDFNKYHAGFICTPPIFHIKQALILAQYGIHLFIEKPLSNTLGGEISKLQRIQKRKSLIIMVGYNQRFNNGIIQIKNIIESHLLGKIYYVRAEFGQYLPDWRPWQDYKKSYTAQKSLGGGILLDGSHEIDYLLWMFGYNKIKRIQSIIGKYSNLSIDVEDLIEIQIEYENGPIISLNLNMLEPRYNRYVKIVGEKGIVKYDFTTTSLELFKTKTKVLSIFKNKQDMNGTYIKEIKYFFSCIKKKKQPEPDIISAKNVLLLIDNIKRTMGEMK